MKKTVSIIIALCLVLTVFCFGCAQSHDAGETLASTAAPVSDNGESPASTTKDKKEKESSTDESSEESSTEKTDETKTDKKESTTDKSTKPSEKDKEEKESETERESSTKKPSTTKKPDTTTKEKSTDSASDKEPDKSHCGLTIECLTLLDNMDKLHEGHEKYVPKNGYILKNYSVKLQEGDTVYDVLMRACNANNIPVNQRAAGSSVYIVGINNIDEGDCTKQSGWTYYVNGNFPLKPIDKYTLEGGEEIHFKYVTSYNDRL